LSISKKLAAVVSAAAVVASTFAAMPASAESTGDFLNRTVSSSVDRTIDPTAKTVKFYAGESVDLYFNGNIKSNVLTQKALANTVLTVDGGYSVVSGTMSQEGGKSIYLSGQMGDTPFNEMSQPNATEFKVTKTLSANANSINFDVNVYLKATTDVVLTFNPVVKLGDYVVTSDDLSYGNSMASSRSGGAYSPDTNGTTRVGRAEDKNFRFYSDTVCINTTGLAAGDVLEHSWAVSDGTATVGTNNPYWNVRNAQGMTNGMGTSGSTYTFASLAEGSSLSINGSYAVGTPVAGTTYTAGGIKVVKQGSTENLITACSTTGATAALTVTGTTINATIDKATDASAGGMGGGMGGKYDTYVCTLYASTDASRTNVLKSSRGYFMMPAGGGPGDTTTKCSFSSVATGTYVVGIRGLSYRGMSEEKIVTGTVTVTGGTPVVVKKSPKVPTIATKVKAGKTFSIALHATKGTAKTAANLDGLVTKVVLASSSKGFCSITPVIKSKKIAGYTVKGLKVNATKCAVTITITGNTLFNTLTKTVKVNVTK
jgi:hypothetical protein